MKRILFIALVAAFGVAVLSTGHGYAQKAPYVLGFMSDLTGPYSSLGKGNKRGMEIALDVINAAGGVNGRQLKAIYYDGETNVAKGVLHTKKLIEVNKAVALVGYTTSSVVMAVLPMLEDNKIVLIAASAPEILWIPTKNWVFNTVARQKEGSIPVLVDVLKRKGAKKIAYLYSDYLLGTAGKVAFEETMKNTKMMPAIIEKYPFGNTELGPQLTHIKAAGADSILITGLQTDTAAAIKIARDLGFAGPIVCDYAIGTPEFIDLIGKYGEGVVTTAQKALVAYDLPDTDVQKKVAIQLNKEYTKRFGPYNMYAGHLWDSTHLIAEALKKVDPNLDPTKSADLAKIREQIRDNLEKTKGFVGQNGVFNYTPNNHNGLGLNCYPPVVIDKGRWRLYKAN